VLEQEAGLRAGAEDGAPEIERCRVDLLDGVEADEGQRLALRSGLHVGRARIGLVAQEAPVQADEAFGRQRVAGVGCGVGDRVHDPGVDPGEPGGVGVGQVGELQGRRSGGKDGQAHAGGQSHALDQDIDAVLADLLDDALGRGARQVAPVGAGGADAPGEVVGDRPHRVAGGLDRGRVQVGDERLEEIGAGVAVQIA
jgi:hypothetical protein